MGEKKKFPAFCAGNSLRHNGYIYPSLEDCGGRLTCHSILLYHAVYVAWQLSYQPERQTGCVGSWDAVEVSGWTQASLIPITMRRGWGEKIKHLTIRSDIRDRVADGGNQHVSRQTESTYPSLWICGVHHNDYVRHAIRLCNVHWQTKDQEGNTWLHLIFNQWVCKTMHTLWLRCCCMDTNTEFSSLFYVTVVKKKTTTTTKQRHEWNVHSMNNNLAFTTTESKKGDLASCTFPTINMSIEWWSGLKTLQDNTWQTLRIKRIISAWSPCIQLPRSTYNLLL